MQVANFLQDKFPELEGSIQGENYPSPPVVEFLSHLTSLAQLIGLMWMVLGKENLFRMVGMRRPPAWASTVHENGIQIGIFLFLLLPQILGRFTTTGAFEIFLDGDSVFSKLAEGRFPNADELVAAMKAAGLESKE